VVLIGDRPERDYPLDRDDLSSYREYFIVCSLCNAESERDWDAHRAIAKAEAAGFRVGYQRQISCSSC
jgi:hypothetical protein